MQNFQLSHSVDLGWQTLQDISGYVESPQLYDQTLRRQLIPHSRARFQVLIGKIQNPGLLSRRQLRGHDALPFGGSFRGGGSHAVLSVKVLGMVQSKNN